MTTRRAFLRGLGALAAMSFTGAQVVTRLAEPKNDFLSYLDIQRLASLMDEARVPDPYIAVIPRSLIGGECIDFGGVTVIASDGPGA